MPARGNRNTGEQHQGPLRLLAASEWTAKRPESALGDEKTGELPCLAGVAGSTRHLSCHQALAVGSGNTILGALRGRAGPWLTSPGEGWVLDFLLGWNRHRRPMWRKAKAVHYLFKFIPFPQNWPPHNGQRERWFGFSWPHNMSCDRLVTICCMGVLLHFPSINLYWHPLRSTCPLLGTLRDIDSRPVTLSPWPGEGHCLGWGTNNFDIKY